jgi:hypothetical protein
MSSSNRGRAMLSGLGAKSSGVWISPGALRVQLRQDLLVDHRSYPGERLLRSCPVVDVLEELQHHHHLVGTRLLEPIDVAPAEIRRDLNPRMVDRVLVEKHGEARGG